VREGEVSWHLKTSEEVGKGRKRKFEDRSLAFLGPFFFTFRVYDRKLKHTAVGNKKNLTDLILTTKQKQTKKKQNYIQFIRGYCYIMIIYFPKMAKVEHKSTEQLLQ
jgi:hypothetical protein